MKTITEAAIKRRYLNMISRFTIQQLIKHYERACKRRHPWKTQMLAEQHHIRLMLNRNIKRIEELETLVRKSDHE